MSCTATRSIRKRLKRQTTLKGVEGLKHIEDTFRGQGKLDLYYQGWLPNGAPRAILLIVHGLAEHSGRYMNLVNHLVPRGYAVYSHDHQGHGRSPGLRCYVERFSHYPDDLKTFLGEVRRRHDSVKVFMLGHSVGATIAVAYASHNQGGLSGLIVTGASLKVGKSFSPLHIAIARLLSRLLPKMGIAVIDAAAISRDENVVKAYINDPLVYRGKLRARTGAELIRVMLKLPQQMPEIALPILIMHGSADRLSDPSGSQLLYERVSSKDKTLKLYDGFYHEILNEPGHKQVLGDIEGWLTARS